MSDTEEEGEEGKRARESELEREDHRGATCRHVTHDSPVTNECHLSLTPSLPSSSMPSIQAQHCDHSTPCHTTEDPPYNDPPLSVSSILNY